jgi:hypothetical protein
MPEKLIRIDLSETEIPQPCPQHTKAGFQSDCDECEATATVPGVIPELAGLFVEIKNPNLLPYGKTKALFSAKEGQTVGDYKEQVVAPLITAWNVVDAETGEELPLPSQDATALDRAIDVVTPVFDRIAQLRRDRAVPKENATS